MTALLYPALPTMLLKETQLEGVQVKVTKKLITDVEEWKVEINRLFSLERVKTKGRCDNIFKICKVFYEERMITNCTPCSSCRRQDLACSCGEKSFLTRGQSARQQVVHRYCM